MGINENVCNVNVFLYAFIYGKKEINETNIHVDQRV